MWMQLTNLLCRRPNAFLSMSCPLLLLPTFCPCKSLNMSLSILSRSMTSAKVKASHALMEQLGQSLKQQGDQLSRQVKGLIVFKIDDDDEWTLDLRPDSEQKGTLKKGGTQEKPDLTLAMSDAVFAQLVAGKLNPQTAFLMRKLKLTGGMGVAMKLQPVLDAAAPKSKM